MRWKNKRCAVCGQRAMARGALVHLRGNPPRWYINLRLWLAPKTFLCRAHQPQTVAQVVELIRS